MQNETVPCGLCETPTKSTGTQRCDRCWELERRIDSDRELARRILDQPIPSNDVWHLSQLKPGDLIAFDGPQGWIATVLFVTNADGLKITPSGTATYAVLQQNPRSLHLFCQHDDDDEPRRVRVGNTMSDLTENFNI